MKPTELKMFISVKSYDEKTAENDRNWYVVENMSILNINSTN